MSKPASSDAAAIPKLVIPWMDGTPYDLAFSRAIMWDRIQRGLEQNQAVQEIVSSEKLIKPVSDTLEPRDGWKWQTYSEGSAALNLGGDALAPDKRIQAVVALYARYDELVRSEWDSIKPEIREVFMDAGLKQLKDKHLTKYSQLESLKHALRLANKEQRPQYEQRVGLLYYQWMRPYYYVEGVEDPSGELNKIRTGIHFLGKYVGAANPDLATILDTTEKILEEMGFKTIVANNLGSAWAFQPRPMNNLKKLSNHALGRAIDVDPATNPHIQGADAKLVDQVLADLNVSFRFSEAFSSQKFSELPAALAITLYSKMLVISKAIQTFLQEHLAKWEAMSAQKESLDAKLKGWDRNPKSKPTPAESSAAKITRDALGATLQSKPYSNVAKLVKGLGGIDQARTARNRGVMTISALMFIAFKKAGADLNLNERSGLEYKTAKDTMHFEVLPKKAPSRSLERETLPFARWWLDPNRAGALPEAL